MWGYTDDPESVPRSVDLGADGQMWTGLGDGDRAGVALASGDLGGDGVADLVISAPFAAVARGAAYVISDIAQRTGGGLDAADAVITGEPISASLSAFGLAVAVVSDVDADGYDELAVSAPHWSSTARGEEAGAIYLYRGPIDRDLHAEEADETLYGTYAGERAGSTLDAGGDLDGDGLGELLVGASGWSLDGTTQQGAAIVVWGAGW